MSTRKRAPGCGEPRRIGVEVEREERRETGQEVARGSGCGRGGGWVEAEGRPLAFLSLLAVLSLFPPHVFSLFSFFRSFLLSPFLSLCLFGMYVDPTAGHEEESQHRGCTPERKKQPNRALLCTIRFACFPSKADLCCGFPARSLQEIQVLSERQENFLKYDGRQAYVAEQSKRKIS